VGEYIPMRETYEEAYCVMHAQEKNIQGKIFGGYLIRKALELAYISGRKAFGENLKFSSIDTILFIKPVSIGQILKFESLIIYAD